MIIKLLNKINMIEMVFVEGSSFLMGSKNGDPDELPVHNVFIDNFQIGKYPITQKQWKTVLGSLPKAIIVKNDNFPITEISWYEAIEFCNKLSISQGVTPCYSREIANFICTFSTDGYRLPTEAEWEYAARGGNKSGDYLYSGSDNLDEVAWYVRNSDKKVHLVAQKKQNELGIFDMSGNIYEYCWDIYNSYKPDPQNNPTGPYSNNKNPFRVIRGGNCYGLPYRQRCTARWKYKYMGYKHDFIGFRVVKSI